MDSKINKIRQYANDIDNTAIDLGMNKKYTGDEKFDLLYHRVRNNCILINQLLDSIETEA